MTFKSKTSRGAIIYRIQNSTMGDGMTSIDCAAYREWARSQISAEFPDHDVEVNDDCLRPSVWTDSDNLAGAIEAFIFNLWDRCPWERQGDS